MSLEDEIWTEPSPDHPQQHPGVWEEKLKWEKEPGTHITVTITEKEESNGEDKHQIFKKADDEDQGHQGKRVDEEVIQEDTRGVDPSVNASLASLSPHFSSTIAPPLIITSITTQGPADMRQSNLHTEDQNTSLSALKNILLLLSTNQNNEHENSSLDQVESSEEHVDAAPTAIAARAGPTALSLPSTFKPKSKTKHPNIKDKHIAKRKKNKLQKEKKVKDKSNKPTNLKRLKQKKDQLTPAPYFPYFEDHYCPPDCACYGRCVSNTALHMLRLTSVIL